MSNLDTAVVGSFVAHAPTRSPRVTRPLAGSEAAL